jgi:hypothetical protein
MLDYLIKINMMLRMRLLNRMTVYSLLVASLRYILLISPSHMSQPLISILVPLHYSRATSAFGHVQMVRCTAYDQTFPACPPYKPKERGNFTSRTGTESMQSPELAPDLVGLACLTG